MSASLRQLRDVSGLTLSEAQLMGLLDIKKSTYWKRKKEGRYRHLQVGTAPDGKPLGRKVEYSGALVQRWRDGVGNRDASPARHFHIAARASR